jgi:hypothetical protein
MQGEALHKHAISLATVAAKRRAPSVNVTFGHSRGQIYTIHQSVLNIF